MLGMIIKKLAEPAALFVTATSVAVGDEKYAVLLITQAPSRALGDRFLLDTVSVRDITDVLKAKLKVRFSRRACFRVVLNILFPTRFRNLRLSAARTRQSPQRLSRWSCSTSSTCRMPLPLSTQFRT